MREGLTQAIPGLRPLRGGFCRPNRLSCRFVTSGYPWLSPLTGRLLPPKSAILPICDLRPSLALAPYGAALPILP